MFYSFCDDLLWMDQSGLKGSSSSVEVEQGGLLLDCVIEKPTRVEDHTISNTHHDVNTELLFFGENISGAVFIYISSREMRAVETPSNSRCETDQIT